MRKIKNKNKQRLNKFMAFMLTFLTVSSSLPLHIFAEEMQSETQTTITFGGEEIEMNGDGSFSITSDFSIIDPPENNVIINQTYIELPEPVTTTIPIATTLARDNISSEDNEEETAISREELLRNQRSSNSGIVVNTEIDGQQRNLYIPEATSAQSGIFRSTAGFLPNWLLYHGSTVSTGVYEVVINGETFIAYCLDHHLPSPLETGPSNFIVSTANSYTGTNPIGGQTVTREQLDAILNRGYPQRTPESLGLQNSNEAYYATRMALAMWVNYPSSAWSANPTYGAVGQRVLNAALQIAGRTTSFSAEQLSRTLLPPSELQNFRTTSLPNTNEIIELTRDQQIESALIQRNAISVINEEIESFSTGITATPPNQTLPIGSWVSEVITVTNHNGSFSINWGAGTPAGAEIISATYQTVLATFPQNLTDITDRNDFRIRIPEQNTPGSLSIDIIGTPFLQGSQWGNPLDSGHQPAIWGRFNDSVPGGDSNDTEVRLNWNPETEHFYGHLRIIKQDMQVNNLAGARFTITGPENFNQTVIVSASGWNSSSEFPEGLATGTYTITEITPPEGFSLASNPTQTVTVTANNTAQAPAIVTFTNERTTDGGSGDGGGNNNREDDQIHIRKLDGITGEIIQGAVVRIEGISASTVSLPDGQLITINNTSINATATLSSGFTPPPIGQGVTSSIIDGVWTINNLPPGAYIVTELQAPDGYSLIYPISSPTVQAFWKAPDEANVVVNMPNLEYRIYADENGVDWSLVLGGIFLSGEGGDFTPPPDWYHGGVYIIPGDVLEDLIDFDIELTAVPNLIDISFRNYPYSEVVVYKREAANGIGSNELLEGATFRIQGVGVDRTAVSDSNGRVIFGNLPAGLDRQYRRHPLRFHWHQIP
jgi:hypothetical protein